MQEEIQIHRSINTHLERLAKLLRPENDLEWMTALAEDACNKYHATHLFYFPLIDVNTSIAELSTQEMELNILEMDFIRAIDARDPKGKQHLEANGNLRFREAKVISAHGLHYPNINTRMTAWQVLGRYIKSSIFRRLLIPESWERTFANAQRIAAGIIELSLVNVGSNCHALLDETTPTNDLDIVAEPRLSHALLDETTSTPSKAEPDENVDAFLAEMEALLAEEDDDLPIDEDWIPKTAPTG